MSRSTLPYLAKAPWSPTDTFHMETANSPAAASRRRLSRRGFIAGAAAVGLGGGAAYTGLRGSRAEGSIAVANWPLYIDEKTKADFSAATGIALDYHEAVDDNDEFTKSVEQSLGNQRSIGYDIVVLTEWMAAKWIFNRWTQPFDLTLLPNRANIDSAVADPSFDPSRRYSMPWMSGIVGITYDTSKVGEIRSVGQLFDKRLVNQVGILSEMRDSVGLVMLSMGFSPEGATPDQAKAAIDKIAKGKTDFGFRFYDTDYTDALLSGEINASIAWSGDISDLKAKKPSLQFVVPDDGAMLFTDSMIIPKWAENPEGAHRFINFVYQPRISAQILSAAAYLSPVKGAVDELARNEPEAARSPALNPSAEVRRKLHSFRTMSDSMSSELQSAFDKLAGR